MQQQRIQVGVGLALVLALGGLYFALQGEAPPQEHPKKILYWVDPMEPQIHYEAPGKSRMNMDLIPVYEPSELTLSGAVINQLGVRVASVERGKLSTETRCFGRVQADEDSISHIHAYVEGTIERVYTKRAQAYVEKGQPLFEIYSKELNLAQKEYLMTLASKDPSVNKTAARERLRSLRISEEQIAQLDATQKPNPRVTVFSPQAGYIDSLNIREGMWVKPETTIMSLTDLSSVWVIAEVFPKQLATMKVGQDVIMRLHNNGQRRWKGSIDYIYPELDPIALTGKIRIRLSNTDFSLKPYMTLAVDVYSLPKEGLKIPKEALIETHEGTHVIMSLGKGRFSPRSVTTGLVVGKDVEILSGLQEGESVVTSAQFLLDSEISLRQAFVRLDSAPTEAPKEQP